MRRQRDAQVVHLLNAHDEVVSGAAEYVPARAARVCTASKRPSIRMA